ncbi:type II secretion system protein [Marinomonas epiphytica]
MSPRKLAYRQSGMLLIEMLVVCALISIILPTLIQLTQSLLQQQTKAKYYLQTEQLKAALNDQFSAQWGRLKPAACSYPSHLGIHIANNRDVPDRLKGRNLVSGSDWLAASDFGFCRLSLNSLLTHEVSLTNKCGWKSRQTIVFRSCIGSYSATLNTATSQKVTLQVVQSDALNQAGIFERDLAYYWYVGKGKEGTPALWRRPQIKGNALEIWNGLEKLAIYPFLDTSANGKVDGIATAYGQYPLTQVKALWVEYVYRLPSCSDDDTQTNKATTYSYQTLRGEQWQFQPPCTQLGQHLIDLSGGQYAG